MFVLAGFTASAFLITACVFALACALDPEFARALLGTAPARTVTPIPVHIETGPVYCERSRRWRDPVTCRFVKSPVR